MSNAIVSDRQNGGAVDQQPTKMPSFGEQLARRKDTFNNSLPAHIPVERFMRVVMTAVQRNPELLQADRESLWVSATQAANDGLLPDGREGALVTYKTRVKDEAGRESWIKKVQWMPMIAGLRKKVRNSGTIATWEAHVVHEKDQFEYELGDDPFIKHKPSLDKNPGAVIAAYSVATLKSGEKSREVMTISQLEKVRNASKSKDSGPWVNWHEEMCRKAVARRHSKVLPMSTDLDDLMRRDDALYDLDGAREQAKALSGGKSLSLATKLDALAALPARDKAVDQVPYDAETGEVIDAKAEPDAPQQAALAADEAHVDGAANDDDFPGDETPRDRVLAEIRAEIMSGDGRPLHVILNKLGERRALVTDEDKARLQEAETTMKGRR